MAVTCGDRPVLGDPNLVVVVLEPYLGRAPAGLTRAERLRDGFQIDVVVQGGVASSVVESSECVAECGFDRSLPVPVVAPEDG